MGKKKVYVIFGLTGILLFSLLVAAGDLEPSGPPNPTMKTLDEVEPRIPIHALDLPLTITEPGSYYLVEDVNFTDVPNNAITIQCDDVTIDLSGYTLKGSDSGACNGIYIVGRRNVEIRNGTIRDFTLPGIHEASGSGEGHRIINVRSLYNAFGIYLNGDGHLIKDCTVTSNNHHGIYTGSGSTIIGNVVRDNTDYGIYAVSYCLVDQNTMYNNGTSMFTGTGCKVGLNVAP